jgi:Ca-activated chloride channel family protein
LKLGDNTEDVNQKRQYYQLALDTYKEGILTFPENVPLKYNYEYVKKKLEELGDDGGENRNNEENQDENEENQDENEENQDENEENQDENEENPGDQNQDNNQRDQDNLQQQNEEEQGDDTQNQDGEQEQDSQQEDNLGQDKDESERGQSEQEQEQDEEQNASDYGSELDASDAQHGQMDDNLLQQVLRMLEKQEEESLKNNQEVRYYGEEDEYDW